MRLYNRIKISPRENESCASHKQKMNHQLQILKSGDGILCQETNTLGLGPIEISTIQDYRTWTIKSPSDGLLSQLDTYNIEYGLFKHSNGTMYAMCKELSLCIGTGPRTYAECIIMFKLCEQWYFIFTAKFEGWFNNCRTYTGVETPKLIIIDEIKERLDIDVANLINIGKWQHYGGHHLIENEWSVDNMLYVAIVDWKQVRHLVPNKIRKLNVINIGDTHRDRHTLVIRSDYINRLDKYSGMHAVRLSHNTVTMCNSWMGTDQSDEVRGISNFIMFTRMCDIL